MVRTRRIPVTTHADMSPPFPTQIIFRSMYASPRHSSRNSFTVPATAIEKLPEEYRLHNIALSNNLWSHLKAYTMAVWQCTKDRTHNMPEIMKPLVNLPFPTIEQQQNVARRAKRWFDFYTGEDKYPVAVSCELEIQDEIKFSLTTPLNYALQVSKDTHTPLQPVITDHVFSMIDAIPKQRLYGES